MLPFDNYAGKVADQCQSYMQYRIILTSLIPRKSQTCRKQLSLSQSHKSVAFL